MRTGKAVLLGMLSVVVMLSVAGCKKEKSDGLIAEEKRGVSNGLMAGATPESSVLGFSVYDGETRQSIDLYLEEEERAVLELLDQVEAEKVEDWTADKVTFPIYSVWCGSEDGYGVSGAWSNGYWITKNDEVYRYDFDFEALFAEDYRWQKDDEEEASVIYMPRGNLFVRDEDGWRVEFLTEAKEPEVPGQIEMYIAKQTEEDITVSFVNNGDEEWCFGEAFDVEVFLDGVWYELPMLPGAGWNDIGMVVEPEEEREHTYYVQAYYGEFYPGTYRILVEGLMAEFAVAAE